MRLTPFLLHDAGPEGRPHRPPPPGALGARGPTRVGSARVLCACVCVRRGGWWEGPGLPLQLRGGQLGLSLARGLLESGTLAPWRSVDRRPARCISWARPHSGLGESGVPYAPCAGKKDPGVLPPVHPPGHAALPREEA